MHDWKLHIPSENSVLQEYRCGLTAGQRLILRKDLIITDHSGNPTGEVHAKGEIWIVLPGIRTDPVLWLKQPNGERHTWDDDMTQVDEWFEVADSAPI